MIRAAKATSPHLVTDRGEHGRRAQLAIAPPAATTLPEWERRHAEGRVPDCWPYGLDKLAADSLEVHATELPRLGRVLLAARARTPLRGPFEWERLLRRYPGDVVLAWDERAAVPLGFRAGRRTVSGVIWLTDRPPRHLRVAREGLARCGALWALSSAQVPVLREALGSKCPPLHHLLFGIDHHFYTPSADPTGDWADRPVTICSIGNDQHRDFPTLMAGFAQLDRDDSPSMEVVTRQHLPAAAQVTHVRSLAPCDVVPVYRRARVCVTPLRGNLHVSGITSILEAMSCGTPVIATNTPGMTDYVIDGETGLLVEVGDAGGIARAVRQIIEQPELACSLIENGLNAVHSRFNTDAMAGRIRGIISAR